MKVLEKKIEKIKTVANVDTSPAYFLSCLGMSSNKLAKADAY